MKFCMITTFFPPYHFGGDAVYVYNLSNELASRGHEVSVVHNRDAFEIFGNPPRPVPPVHPRVRVHTLKSRLKGISPLINQQTGQMGLIAGRIRGILAEGGFDVIHFHNVSLMGGLDLLAEGDAVKLYSLHDYWLVCPTHVLFRDRKKACESPRCLKCQLIHLRPPQLWRRLSKLRSAVGHVDRFLSGSRFCLEKHRERGLELDGEVLPLFSPFPVPDNGSGDEIPASLEGVMDEPYFLFVGRLERLKGLQDVLPYFAQGDGPSLLVAGAGSFGQALRELAGSSPRVHFLGNRSPAELAWLYGRAIATVMPSLAYEISPLVLAETWSMKTPVVTRDVGALSELVRDAGGGLCFNSQQELFGQLDKLANDVSTRGALGEAGFRAYERDWTAERHLDRYLELVDRLLGERRA